jgi:hypothetical protein
MVAIWVQKDKGDKLAREIPIATMQGFVVLLEQDHYGTVNYSHLSIIENL